MAETEKTNATVSKFERMSVEELEEAIRIYLQADDLEENTEDLLLAAEVLDRKKEAMGDHVDTDAHWDRFQRDYLPFLDEKTSDEGDAEKAKDNVIKMSETDSVSCDTGKKPTAKRVIRVVAVAALIVLVLGLTACAVIPQVRDGIVSFLRSFGNHSVVSGDSNDAELSPIADTETYELAGYAFCIPKEYELDSRVEDDRRACCGFNGNNSAIIIYISSSNYNPLQFDTEEAESKAIQINGTEGYIIKKGSNEYVTWGSSIDNRIIYIYGENVIEEVLLNIANTFTPLNE